MPAEVVVGPPADPDLRDHDRQQRGRQGEQDACDHSRTGLGGEHLLAHRSREEGERDRPVPVLGRRDEDADQGREEERDPAHRRDVSAERFGGSTGSFTAEWRVAIVPIRTMASSERRIPSKTRGAVQTFRSSAATRRITWLPPGTSDRGTPARATSSRRLARAGRFPWRRRSRPPERSSHRPASASPLRTRRP